MASKGSFENQYEDVPGVSILTDSMDGLSEEFEVKLRSFKESKLNIMHTKLRNDIFCDGTVYTGSAGFALYHLMRLPIKKEPVEQLVTALNYIDLKTMKGRRISFLCGDAGPLAIATIISYKLGSRRPSELEEYKSLAQRLMSLISLLDDSPDEILYGKAGYLYALLFVNKMVEKDLIPANHIEKVIFAILRSGKEFAKQIKSASPLLWQWHEKIYFGAAHGMAGILHILLQPAIDWLLGHQYETGNFPSSMGSSSGDRLVQWCHGAPGYVPLCITAYQIFKKDKYMEIALQCGDVVWSRGLCAKGYSMCHGVSGNAYTFLQLYQATKKPLHLYRACCFMEWCVVERRGTEQHAPDRPASLFEGLLGRLYLLEDIHRPLTALFPGMCL